jgi:SAM-dependent methyltransferase
MKLKVSRNLEKLDVYATGNELASIMGINKMGGRRVLTWPISKKRFVYSFKNPVLMTDNWKIGKLNPTIRDSLFALYGSRPRIVEYDGVSTSWDVSHLGVWCPSIDTILFAKALKKFFEEGRPKNVAEIGCGSGFLSKYILKRGRGIKSILINDINKYAIKSAKDNIRDSRAIYAVGNGLKKLGKKKFDLIVCNPPYVPREKSIDDNPYEGTALLYHLVHEGGKYLNKGGVIITNVSSLCWDEVFDKEPEMKMEILEKMEVPLKVNNILNDKSWVRYLRGKGLKKKMKKGYEYWQKLNIVILKK